MKETIKNIKQQFFAYRNGMLADTLRKAGDPHKMIFGLNLPQIIQIAAEIGKDKALATALWIDEPGCRESRLLAPMLMPAQEFTRDEAIEWCKCVECVEVADVLCHRLLRQLSFAQQMAEALLGSTSPLEKYTGARLLLNLLIANKVQKTDALKARLEAEYATANRRLRALIADILEEE